MVPERNVDFGLLPPLSSEIAFGTGGVLAPPSESVDPCFRRASFTARLGRGENLLPGTLVPVDNRDPPPPVPPQAPPPPPPPPPKSAASRLARVTSSRSAMEFRASLPRQISSAEMLAKSALANRAACCNRGTSSMPCSSRSTTDSRLVRRGRSGGSSSCSLSARAREQNRMRTSAVGSDPSATADTKRCVLKNDRENVAMA